MTTWVPLRFDCPYPSCAWPRCQSGDFDTIHAHPKCALLIVEAKRTVRFDIQPKEPRPPLLCRGSVHHIRIACEACDCGAVPATRTNRANISEWFTTGGGMLTAMDEPDWAKEGRDEE